MPTLPATCHPNREASRDGRCRECCQLEGLLGLGHVPRLPAVVRGVQRAGRTEIPRSCPRCGISPPAWRIDDEAAHCFICGEMCYRLDAARVIDPPRPLVRNRRVTPVAEKEFAE
jgi:hypothetical protein